MITVKPMQTPEEMAGKAYVHWKSWHETYTGLIDSGYLAGITLEKCTKIAQRWPDGILVAKDGDRVIGFTGYGPYRDDTMPGCGEVYAIYVLAEYHSRGVGYALMNAALEKLSAYDTAALWVLEGNERAIRFYERYGFTFDGARQELVMGKPAAEMRMIYRREKKNSGQSDAYPVQ